MRPKDAYRHFDYPLEEPRMKGILRGMFDTTSLILLIVFACLAGCSESRETETILIGPGKSVTRPKGYVTKAPDPAEIRQQAQLMAQIQLLEAAPCSNSLEFVDLPWIGWHVTCPGCSALKADRVFPKVILQQVDLHAINGKIRVQDLLEMIGECS